MGLRRGQAHPGLCGQALHRLADTLTKLLALERKAFGLDDKDDRKPNAYEDGLRKLAMLGGTACA